MWGDFEPVWTDEKEFESIFSLMMRHMNVIAHMLMETPEDFEPMYAERQVEGKTYTMVDEWCEGYWRGVQLAQDQWDEGGREMATLLTPILAFTEVTDWKGHEYAHHEIETIQRAIAPHQTAQESRFEAGQHLHYLQCEPALLLQQLGLLRAE